MKRVRQNKILELIGEYDIDTQEELGKRLHEREYLIGIMVYQVPGEDGQIRLLRIAQSYGLFQCSGIVAPTARMHVG